jgi:Zn-dependent protease with chaperone function
VDAAPTRVDERALAAGTTARFVLLVALLVVSSCLMLLYVATALSAYDGFSCSLAAGVDPTMDSPATMVVKRGDQWEAYYACTLRQAAPPPWWIPLSWLLLLAVLTAMLFWLLPRWKSRRVVPLAAVDKGRELSRLLDELTSKAGLTRAPRFVVDPAAMSAGAVVWGSNRRPTVCLHAGLLVRRHTDPQAFKAVLLHELGHVHNRDITVTYLTVALWRVYAMLALPPFLVWCGVRFATADRLPFWSAEAPVVTRGLLLVVVMTVLVYLARADVLRNREIYADLAAVRWGADPEGWRVPAAVERGKLRAVRSLFRNHPGWGERRQAFLDPEVLFGLRPLPIVLTGAAAAVLSSNAGYALVQYVLLTRWIHYATTTVAASLVVGVVGVALWRAVVHAVLTKRRVPSGVRAGMWLGIGLVFGMVVTGQGTVNDWLPDRPVVLGLMVAAAVVFTCWTTRCAVLWVSAWQGRTLRPVLLLSLVAATLALGLWFAWWQAQGMAYTAGMSYDVAQVRNTWVANLIGPTKDNPPLSAADRAVMLVMMVGGAVTDSPLALVAVGGLWAVPLLAWLVRPTGRTPRWARDAAADLDEDTPVGAPLPSFRRVLLPGLFGGLVAWVALAGVAAYLHARLPGEKSVTAFISAYLALSILALVAGGTAAAMAACASARAHRLFAALIASQTAVLVGFVGLYIRGAVDGCVAPISITTRACAWRPGSVTHMSSIFLAPAVVLGVVAAVVVAAAAALVSRRSDAGWPEVRRMAGRRLAVSLLCLVALGFGATRAVALSPMAATLTSPGDTQRLAKQWIGAPTASGPSSALTVALQVDAWNYLGGSDLIHRFFLNRRNAFAIVTAYVNNGKRGLSGLGAVRPLCADIDDFAKTAVRYFRVPDPDTHRLWEKFVAQAWQGGQACVKALDEQNAENFDAAMKKLAAAQDTGNQIDDRVEALIRVGR